YTGTAKATAPVASSATSICRTKHSPACRINYWPGPTSCPPAPPANWPRNCGWHSNNATPRQAASVPVHACPARQGADTENHSRADRHHGRTPGTGLPLTRPETVTYAPSPHWPQQLQTYLDQPTDKNRCTLLAALRQANFKL